MITYGMCDGVFAHEFTGRSGCLISHQTNLSSGSFPQLIAVKAVLQITTIVASS